MTRNYTRRRCENKTTYNMVDCFHKGKAERIADEIYSVIVKLRFPTMLNIQEIGHLLGYSVHQTALGITILKRRGVLGEKLGKYYEVKK